MPQLAYSLLLASFLTTGALGQGWVDFSEETSSRLVASNSLGAGDVEEKDYAWADFDRDGDIDLVCVRKEPFTTTGREVNVLFMNEDGVLVDRTQEYASSSDVSGDNGFLTEINDRDIAIVDVDMDGWPDLVTATTLMDNAPKHVSHPRIYMNLGEAGGVWQGFRYEEARIPQMHSNASPRFCSVDGGDLTGDGMPDLYFGDYDSGTSQIYDFNNRLLVNVGNGYFQDDTTSRMTDEMALAAFGAASVIVDMNNDGVLDVVKQTSLNPPQHVAIMYNNPSNEGYFNRYDIIDQEAPYFVSADDLNGDGRMDLVVVDDGTDHYYLNRGNGSDGMANFDRYSFSGSNGFGGNSWVSDLNKDGHNDVIITDVDVDISGCSRNTFIYRNMGDAPNNSFQQQSTGIPSSRLQGVHDIAVFDIDGDGWDDLVLGRCNGTEIWMNQPPVGLVFQWPDGIPSYTPEGAARVLTVQLVAIGGGSPEDGSLVFHVKVNGGAEDSIPGLPIGDDLYQVELPAGACTDRIEFSVTADLDTGQEFSDPATGSYVTIVGDGVDVTWRDDFEGDVSPWEVLSSDTLTTGAWEAADPNGTIYGVNQAAPEDDATAGSDAVTAFVTENGPPGGSASANDLDGGWTALRSPIIDLEGSDATISFEWWMYDSRSSDLLTAQITNNGVDWVTTASTISTASTWRVVEFAVSDFVEPTSTVQVQFIVDDAEPFSIVEAGIDDFQIEQLICAPLCPADLDGDTVVGVTDLLRILDAWGQSGVAEDLDGSGSVDVGDLLVILAAWGPC
jgi:hypothetical protein